MKLRPARARDQQALRAFRCADGSHHESDLERWFNYRALKWLFADEEARSLWVLLDCDESVEDDIGAELLGVAAVEPGDEADEWFVRALGILRRRQGRKLGTALLLTVLDQLREQSPDGVGFWKVDPANAASMRMSKRVGAEPDVIAGSELILYTIRLSPADPRRRESYAEVAAVESLPTE